MVAASIRPVAADQSHTSKCELKKSKTPQKRDKTTLAGDISCRNVNLNERKCAVI